VKARGGLGGQSCPLKMLRKGDTKLRIEREGTRGKHLE